MSRKNESTEETIGEGFTPNKLRLFVPVLVVIGLIVLFVGLVAIQSLVMDKKPAAKKATPAVVDTREPVPVKVPTEAELQAAKNSARTDGTITAISTTEVTLQVEGEAQPVTYKLTDKTQYLATSLGGPAEKSAIKVGQKAVVGYDKSTNTAGSVWGGYDE